MARKGCFHKQKDVFFAHQKMINSSLSTGVTGTVALGRKAVAEPAKHVPQCNFRPSKFSFLKERVFLDGFASMGVFLAAICLLNRESVHSCHNTRVQEKTERFVGRLPRF